MPRNGLAGAPKDVLGWQLNKARLVPTAGDNPSLDLTRRILSGVDIIAAERILKGGLVGQKVTVGTTPTLVLQKPYARSWLLLNPARSAGSPTTDGTLLAAALHAATGDTTATPLDVSTYRTGRFYLRVTAVGSPGSTVQVDALTKDPVSGLWAISVPDIFNSGAQTAPPGTYYADLGELGIDESFAIQWQTVGGGTWTGSISYVLKDSLGGSSGLTDQSIYLGASGVSTLYGYPLLEGASVSWYIAENTALYAVAATPLPLRYFTLG